MQAPAGGVQLHASCVSLSQNGVLLMGDSGSGKSDLSLRLIDAGATLVADDRVNVIAKNGSLVASCPATIAGKLEIRGAGILTLPCLSETAIRLAVMLERKPDKERLPERQFFDCLGLQVPLLSVDAYEPSACAKIRTYIQYGL